MDGATHLVTIPALMVLAATLALVAASPASSQTVPFIDTEDATLSEVDVGGASVHPIVSFDVRNGDYARGAYDDDAAGLGRVPVHVSVGAAAVLKRGADGQGTLFLVGQSSNGFHAPRPDERSRPRGWYESNTIVGLAWRPVDGLSAAAAYAIKASPNGVASTTHEASLTFLYTGKDAVGFLAPRFAATTRTKGQGGFYTIVGIAPAFPLTRSKDGLTLTLPVSIGGGWRSFYAADSGDRVYGSGGVSVAQPLKIAGAKATLQGEVLALVRDAQLRRRDAPDGTTASIVPLATISLTLAW
ncbi:hypothetical protein ASE88_03605 [Sphingomonas sp. Leaf38]|nr:hypothetical protein ASE88_03605 [Sphingomonas sp. Leaf38]